MEKQLCKSYLKFFIQNCDFTYQKVDGHNKNSQQAEVGCYELLWAKYNFFFILFYLKIGGLTHHVIVKMLKNFLYTR